MDKVNEDEDGQACRTTHTTHTLPHTPSLCKHQKYQSTANIYAKSLIKVAVPVMMIQKFEYLVEEEIFFPG